MACRGKPVSCPDADRAEAGGKTTFLRHICGKERRYVTLDDPSIRMLANNDPALFMQRYPAPVLIDEIQYAPGILPYIKMRLIQQNSRGHSG